MNVVEAQNIALKEEIQEQKLELKAASQKIVALEADNRKENLIITGLPLESYSDATSSATPETVTALSVTHVRDTEQAVLKLCKDCLHIDIITRDISTAYRLKVKQGVNGVGSVIVRFTNRKAHDLSMVLDFISRVLRVTERSSSMKICLEKQRSCFHMQGRCARRKSSTVHGPVAVRSSFDNLPT